ncbi:Primosomal protein DnaI [Sporosarcina pasteurii]|uniref:Primosomal protein DnaI n=2 Tax=Sporosarcina pasteurii TaxID=1474 RepID=A0A380BNK4_SPOPA|nr:Primosomal protein DnaI [Sporosarcina pasteurii]
MNISKDMNPKSYEKPRILTKASDKCIFRICDGRGQIHQENKPGDDYMVICQCRKYKQQLRKIKSAGIPTDYTDKTMNDFKIDMYETDYSVRLAKYAKQAVTGYLDRYQEFEDMGKGFYFYSQTKGSGKSLLSMIIANELIKRYELNALYISVVNMLTELKNKMNQSNSKVGVYDLIESFKKADLLILDDLGVEKATEWSEEILTQILDDRMNYRRPTIITSNVSVEGLERKYPAGRIKSRIEKLTFPLRLPEESVRETLSKQDNEKMAQMLFN